MVLPNMSFKLKLYAGILGDGLLLGLIALTYGRYLHKIVDNIKTGLGLGME
jgi:hypothetical protein